MHRSLSIPEILLMVFSSADIHTLNKLARTCRLFQGPALDLLWRHQKSLVPLLKSMPPDLWEDDDTTGLFFRRPLISTDLAALNKYARRIISLLFIWHHMNVDLETLGALNRYMSTTPLLPNLRKFKGVLPGGNSPILTFMGLFLGARTEVIEIKLNYSKTNTTPSFIPSIKTRCPSLKDLSLHYMGNDSYVVRPISELICEYVELESLDVRSLTCHALAHIATYSALRSLTLGALGMKDICSIKGSGLARVSELNLTTMEDTTTFDRFLSLIHPQQLQKLTLTLSNRSSPSALWQRCFQTLNQHCAATLTTLHIQELLALSDENTRYAMEYPTLEHLFALSHLASLTLSCGGFYELDDDGLRHMALAWPHLEVLCLQTCFDNWIRVEASRITLKGLVHLLEYCPELIELHIAINASIVELHPVNQPGEDIFNDRIVTLTVGNSVIDDPISVAAFFSRVLPSVQHIISWEALGYMTIEDMVDYTHDALREARIYHSRCLAINTTVSDYSQALFIRSIEMGRWVSNHNRKTYGFTECNFTSELAQEVLNQNTRYEVHSTPASSSFTQRELAYFLVRCYSSSTLRRLREHLQHLEGIYLTNEEL